ncbi:hypothetical protein PtB15_9B189 [Puccinia triticina]|nr:hypothetical protein PtB15_9B189 [Puccinia triticina]
MAREPDLPDPLSESKAVYTIPQFLASKKNDRESLDAHPKESSSPLPVTYKSGPSALPELARALRLEEAGSESGRPVQAISRHPIKQP